jgi:hypothetical protein
MSFEEFQEKMRQARIKGMKEYYEKLTKEYREKKNQSPQSEK